MMKILSVVGARPNFMKIAPFIKEITRFNSTLTESEKDNFLNHILVHTGQHYDNRMNSSFFRSLGIPNPDINLGIGSGSHAEQVGKTMIAFEKVIQDIKPEIVVVVGDVNATLACSVTAKKEKLKCCHIEAGLRSGDLSMPEEINRLVTDRLADLLLTPDRISSENLIKEGVDPKKIRFVGNIMIDTLTSNLEKAKEIDLEKVVYKNKMRSDRFNLNFKLNSKPFAVLTMHRPSNVDNKLILESLIDFFINELSKEILLIWPIHPRTLKRLKEFDLLGKIENSSRIVLLHPLEYHDMLRLNIGAKIMLTDSGGLQEECSFLGTPCLTLRPNTERPVTLRENGGTSVLVGNNVSAIRQEFSTSMNIKNTPRPQELWDGKTAERCLIEILSCLKNK